MKRFVLLGVVGLAGAIVAGCPIYEKDGNQCYDNRDCASGQYCAVDGYCYSTITGVAGYAGTVRPPARDAGGATVNPPPTSTPDAQDRTPPPIQQSVDASTDTPPNAEASTPVPGGDASVDATRTEAAAIVYCGNPGDCRAGETCGTDGICHAGDCSNTACINQYVCATTDKGLACTQADPGACAADTECATGTACVDGRCSPLAELCSDQTQCRGGTVCVEGKCVPSCATDAQCGLGFRCRTTLGICDVAGKDCAKTSDCGSPDLVCVQNACVSRCSALGACEDGAGACVNNGCLPVQAITHECDGEGDAGPGCGAGRVCLHHHCYVSCEAPNESACAGLPKTTVCKTLTTSSGAHAVCGSAQNLGADCDPTIGLACAPGKICIDGFCR